MVPAGGQLDLQMPGEGRGNAKHSGVCRGAGRTQNPKTSLFHTPHHPHPRCPCGGRVPVGAVAPAAPSHVAEPRLNSFAVILAVILLLQLSSVFLVANPSCSRQGPPSHSQPPFLAPSPRLPRAGSEGLSPRPPLL